jgi:hypothetical protein
MDKLREEFEQWWNNKMAMCFYSQPKSQKETIHHASWLAWQASRASIVVEIPQRQSLYASGYGDGYFVPSDAGDGLEYEETVDALRSIGLSIKGE